MNFTKEQREQFAKWGKMGGQKTLKKYGKKYFKKIRLKVK